MSKTVVGEQVEKRPNRVTISLSDTSYGELMEEARARFPVAIGQVAFERFMDGQKRRNAHRAKRLKGVSRA